MPPPINVRAVPIDRPPHAITPVPTVKVIIKEMNARVTAVTIKNPAAPYWNLSFHF